MAMGSRANQRTARSKLVDLEWLESNFPCMTACPVHTQAGRYVSLIAEGRYEDAYRYARTPNPFASICGRVCGHPCESACRRGQFDAPISIRALKRFVTERFGPESRNPIDVFADRPQVKRPEKVAVIGSGPAGISFAPRRFAGPDSRNPGAWTATQAEHAAWPGFQSRRFAPARLQSGADGVWLAPQPRSEYSWKRSRRRGERH